MTDAKIESRMHALFAVPFADFTLPQPGRLCSDLRELFLAREAAGDQVRNEIKRPTQGDAVFESKFDLFTWQEKPVQVLREFCHASLLNVLTTLRGAVMPTNVQFDYHAWFHVTRNGGYQGLHNHQNASWSGIFCVDPGDIDPAQPNSGIVRFHDPKALSAVYLDAANQDNQMPFNTGVYKTTHSPGRLLIFPSYLQHEIFPYTGERPRIVVAFNAWARYTA